VKHHVNRKMMALSAVAIILAGVSGCAAGTGGDDSASLKLWLPPLGDGAAGNDPATWDPILADFEKEYDVDVSVTIVPWASYEEKYLTGISSGDGPDVGYMYTEMMGDYINQGAIAPFDDYLTDEATSDLLYLDQGQLEGKQYAMPYVVGGARAIWVNNAILKTAGVQELPATWDDFSSASTKIAAAGLIPTVQPWGSPDRGMLNSSFIPLLWQAGGELFSEDGTKTAFNSKEGVAAATFLLDLIEDGNMPANVTGVNTEDAQQQFLDGDVAFFNGSDVMLSMVEEAEIDYSVIYSLAEKKQGTFVASDALVLLDACEDKQLCTDLVTYLQSGKQMEQVHEFAEYPPIGADEEADEDNPFTPLYSEQADILHTLPIVAGGAAVYNSLYTNLQQMMSGQKTPEEAMRDAAAEGDASLASGG
jgi:multiple sugar transport system substrate-binding protein